jgi:hypothetical protein
MVSSGIPEAQENHAELAVIVGLEMISAVKEFNRQFSKSFNLRIGINSGAVYAGMLFVFVGYLYLPVFVVVVCLFCISFDFTSVCLFVFYAIFLLIILFLKVSLVPFAFPTICGEIQ